jgi:hypothetical protein
MIPAEARGAWRDIETRLRPYVARRVASAAEVDDIVQEILVFTRGSRPCATTSASAAGSTASPREQSRTRRSRTPTIPSLAAPTSSTRLAPGRMTRRLTCSSSLASVSRCSSRGSRRRIVKQSR